MLLMVRAGLFAHTVLFHPVAVVVDNECDNEYYEDSCYNRPSVPALGPALVLQICRYFFTLFGADNNRS